MSEDILKKIKCPKCGNPTKTVGKTILSSTNILIRRRRCSDYNCEEFFTKEEVISESIKNNLYARERTVVKSKP
jgi:transcriptional regulator NrdR family protein